MECHRKSKGTSAGKFPSQSHHVEERHKEIEGTSAGKFPGFGAFRGTSAKEFPGHQGPNLGGSHFLWDSLL